MYKQLSSQAPPLTSTPPTDLKLWWHAGAWVGSLSPCSLTLRPGITLVWKPRLAWSEHHGTQPPHHCLSLHPCGPALPTLPQSNTEEEDRRSCPPGGWAASLHPVHARAALLGVSNFFLFCCTWGSGGGRCSRVGHTGPLGRLSSSVATPVPESECYPVLAHLGKLKRVTEETS